MQLTRCTLYKHMPTNVLSAFAIQLPLLTMLIYKARDPCSLLTRERTHAFSSTAAEKMKQTEREHRSHIMTYLKWLCVMDWDCVYQFTEYLMFYSVSNTFSSSVCLIEYCIMQLMQCCFFAKIKVYTFRCRKHLHRVFILIAVC